MGKSPAFTRYLIDLDTLAGEGLLLPEEFRGLDWGSCPERVDYGRLYEARWPPKPRRWAGPR